jgi:acetyl esterase/lipase
MRNKSYNKNFTTLIFKIILSAFALLLTFSFFVACGEKNREDKSEIPKEIIKIIEDNLLPCSDELGKEYTGGKFSLIRNIKYSNSKPNLVGDLYLPYGIKNFPIAIHIHGGGWIAGNKGTPMGRWWGELFACNGIAVFDIEYTLVPKAKISEQVKEIKCAILWAKKEGKKYGIGSKVILLGGSAGGHLTALTAFSKNNFLPENCEWFDEKSKDNLKVDAAIPFYGVYDFGNPYIKYFEPVRAESENIEETIKKLSPVNYIDFVDFPVLIIHGDADFFVPLDQSVELYHLLVQKGKQAEIFVVKDGAHAFDSFPETEYTKKTKEKLLEFLKKYGFIDEKVVSELKKNTPNNYNHLEKARDFLKRGFFKQAYLEFSKQSEKSKSCETEYGKFLAKAFDMLSQIIVSNESGILSLASPNPSQSNISISFSPHLYLLSAKAEEERDKKDHQNNKLYQKNILEKSENQYQWKPNLNLLYENYIMPIEEKLAELQNLSEYLYSNSCEFYEEDGIPIYMQSFTSEVRIGKKFGKELPILAMTISHIIKFFLDFIFSHDINFDIQKELTLKYFIPLFFVKGEEDITGLLRLAGILYYENSNILNFIRPEKFDSAKQELIKSLELIALAIDEIFLKPKNNDVFSVKDENEDGKFSPGDKFSTGKLYTVPEGIQTNYTRLLDILEIIPNFLDENYFKRVRDFLINLSSKIRKNEPLNFAEMRVLIPDFLKSLNLGEIFPDFISFNIGGFFDAKKPLRAYLPEVIITDIIPDMKEILGKPEINQKISLPSLLIEGELGKLANENDKIPKTGKCYVCFEGERFAEYDGQKTLDGNTIKKLENDCLYIKGKFLFESIIQQRIPLLYIYFKDPTFGGNLFIGKISQGCGTENESFQLANNFSLNKSISYIMTKLDDLTRSFRISF